MKGIKQFLLGVVILGSLFFLFGPEVVPENFQPQEVLNIASNSDVIIIFNSGGWGNTPIEKAEDFRPIIEGIQSTLNEWGYNTVVVPYTRTKNDFLGKMTGAREFFNSFQVSSEDLAEKVDFLAEKFPDKKIIMAGLSNGAAFVVETYEKVSEDAKDSVYAIAAGTPFWIESFESENILQLSNNGKDALSAGKVKDLLFSLIKAPFRWLLSKNRPFYAPGHDYSWSAPEVNSQIVSFLEDKLH